MGGEERRTQALLPLDRGREQRHGAPVVAEPGVQQAEDVIGRAQHERARSHHDKLTGVGAEAVTQRDAVGVGHRGHAVVSLDRHGTAAGYDAAEVQ